MACLWVNVIHCQPQAIHKKWRSAELIVVNDGMGHDNDDESLKYSIRWFCRHLNKMKLQVFAKNSLSLCILYCEDLFWYFLHKAFIHTSISMPISFSNRLILRGRLIIFAGSSCRHMTRNIFHAWTLEIFHCWATFKHWDNNLAGNPENMTFN